MVPFILLVALYALPAVNALRVAAVGDPDIWWHLRTGQWILEHRAIPHADPFSSFGAGKPWAAYSWLFELLLYGLYVRLGLIGILAYTSFMLLTITMALHRLTKRCQAHFPAAIALVYLACFSLSHLYTPRPWLFSILLFILELDILMQVRRTGRPNELAWLPLLFVFWVNLHIQFVDGLIVFGLACLDSLIPSRPLTAVTKVSSVKLFLALLVTVLATFCNPYGWHIYVVAHELASQPGVLNKLQELRAVPFRDPVDWTFLAIALGTVGAFAWSRRKLPFEWAVLCFSIAMGFRSQRDVWILAASATAFLAPTLKSSQPRQELRPGRSAITWSAICAALIIFLGLRSRLLHEMQLHKDLEAALPVRAVDFVEAHHIQGRIFNDYTWGGYLIWRLHKPVSLDGRAALYGDARIDHIDSIWNGKPGWDSNPELNHAGIVIGPSDAPLSQLLRQDARYRLAYEDHLATVFVRRYP